MDKGEVCTGRGPDYRETVVDGRRVWVLRDPRPEWVRRMAEARAAKGLIALKEVSS